MRTSLTVLLSLGLCTAVLGDSDDYEYAWMPNCPTWQSREAKACIWASESTCSSESCHERCIADRFGKNRLDTSLESMAKTGAMCHEMSDLFRSPSSAGSTARRLQIFGALTNSLEMYPIIDQSSRSRKILNSTQDYACATSAEVDAAASGLEREITRVKRMLQEGEPWMGTAVKAVYNKVVELAEDPEKMKAWLSSHCQTATVSGQELEFHQTNIDMGPGAYELTSADVQASEVMYGDVCYVSSSSDDVLCYDDIDTKLLPVGNGCLNSYVPLLGMEAAHVVAFSSAWTTIDEACGDITDETECNAKIMDQELQQALDAMASMDEDATATAMALTEEAGISSPSTSTTATGAAHSGRFGYMAMIVLSLSALAL